MSKMDALRAMREERYEQAQKSARTGQPASRATPPNRPPVAPRAASASVVDGTRASSETVDAAEALGGEPTEVLCGHKNMGGRSCTRPHGHSEKSHRYG